MSKNAALAFTALLAAAIAAFAGAAPASAVICDCGAPLADVTPLSPDDATALSSTAPTTGVTPTTVVDPATALAAASSPDADTAIDPDLTLSQAVGATSIQDSTNMTAAKVVCWSNAFWSQWGTWPYQQRITNTAYWCAKYGVKITMRSSSITGTGALCSMSWRASQLIDGGTGFPYFTMRSSAGFSCPTVIPWIVLHPSHHLDVRRDDRGAVVFAGDG